MGFETLLSHCFAKNKLTPDGLYPPRWQVVQWLEAINWTNHCLLKNYYQNLSSYQMENGLFNG